MFIYGADDFNDGNRELITEFLNIFQGGNGSMLYPEDIKYPFINSLWVNIREGKKLCLQPEDMTQQESLMNVWNS